MIYLLVAIYLCCSVGGLTLVKMGTEHNALSLNPGFFNLSLSYTTVIGLALYVISFIMWIGIVQRFNLSYIQPITTGLSYILIIAASILILKESIASTQWIGMIFILIGVVLMNINNAR